MDRKELIEHLKQADLLVEGNRNNDAVNLAILAYDMDPDIKTDIGLYTACINAAKDLHLPEGSQTDWDYMQDKCTVLIRYLPDWYNTGDIYGYAIY